MLTAAAVAITAATLQTFCVHRNFTIQKYKFAPLNNWFCAAPYVPVHERRHFGSDPVLLHFTSLSL